MEIIFDYGSISKEIKTTDIEILLKRYIKEHYDLTFHGGYVVIKSDKKISHVNFSLKIIRDYLTRQYVNKEISMTNRMKLFYDEFKKTNNLHSLKKFSDGRVYYHFWVNILQKSAELAGLEKTSFEKEIFAMQKEIRDALNMQNPNYYWQAKFSILLKEVKEKNLLYLHDCEFTFSDGQTYKAFWLNSRYHINNLKRKKNITEIEMLYLHEAALVDDALRSNKNKARFKLLNAKMDLIYTRALNGDFSLDGTFSDGKSINKFNGNIRTRLNKYKKMNKKLSEGELELVHTIALYDNLVREEKRAKRGH